MKTLHFSTNIAAQKEIVWHVLFDDQMFQRWANVFAEGSYFQGDWKEGSTVRFLTPEGNGMVSVIEANRRHEFLSIKHLGCVNKGIDDMESHEANAWAPAFENYTLNEISGGTELVIDMDVAPGYETFFEETWPKAIGRIKELAQEMHAF